MDNFYCPKCLQRLNDNGKSLSCENGHCFDKAKQGYVNLLMSNKSSDKRHGDDKLMVEARTDFLCSGHYNPLIEKVAETVKSVTLTGGVILDAGCGEGTYTNAIKTVSENCIVLGVDISKTAVITAAKTYKNIDFCVASVFDLPFANESIDTVVNVFAPDSEKEYLRILKKGGYLIMVTPGINHLFELKAAVYDNPLKNDCLEVKKTGFGIESQTEVKFPFCCDNKQATDLFRMTPYYYKTGATDQLKLEKSHNLRLSRRLE